MIQKNTALQVYVDIRAQYFASRDNEMELKEIIREIMIGHADLPVIELAMLLELIRKDYSIHRFMVSCEAELDNFGEQAHIVSDLIRTGVRGYQESIAKH